jgi:lysophospholipid acyltransferase (LPLAT)-like uncharacterized protein
LSKLLKKLRHPRLIAGLAYLMIRVLGATIRCRFEDQSGLSGDQADQPVIWVFWHNRVLMLPFVQTKFRPDRIGNVLTSQSNDGEIIAGIAQRFGHGAVRGSSNKRPAAALREMVRTLANGTDMVITPDGPRGPRYELQPGTIKLAQLSQCPIMIAHLRFDRAWKLKTWDGFLVPKPFTRVTFVLSPLRHVPRELDQDAFEKTRADLEMEMVRGAEEGTA